MLRVEVEVLRFNNFVIFELISPPFVRRLRLRPHHPLQIPVALRPLQLLTPDVLHLRSIAIK